MGDPLDRAAAFIRDAVEVVEEAKVALEALDDHELAASVDKAVDAARFDLDEALRRLTRP